MPVMLPRLVFASFCLSAQLIACASSQPPDPATEAGARLGVDLELSELEIYASGIDRFARCPPAGGLGQAWIPARVTEAPHDSAVTERAIEQTLKPFRSCYTRGSLHRAADGRAAIVARVGADGKKPAIENYATCGLPIEVIDCMVTEASRIQVEPPPSGTRTVVIPAVFAPRDGYAGAVATAQDTYAASAHVTMDEARPGLHACEQRFRPAGQAPAQGTFALQVDAYGRVVKLKVEPWAGPNDLLTCSRGVVEKLVFTAPPEGGARILARIAFNPRTR